MRLIIVIRFFFQYQTKNLFNINPYPANVENMVIS